jgi:hypothetical protein
VEPLGIAHKVASVGHIFEATGYEQEAAKLLPEKA